MIQEFPSPARQREDAEAFQSIQDLMDLIGSLRAARAEMNIEPKKVLNAVLVVPDSEARSLVQSNLEKVRLLAHIGAIEFRDALPSARVLLKGVWKLGEFGLDLQGAIDYGAERDRLLKELERIKGDIDKIMKKINSHEFMARAPESVVAENKTRHAELLERLARVESNLAKLPPQ